MADAEDVQRGLDAAVACLRALQTIHAAAQEKYIGGQPDEGPYLRILFNTLKTGFAPIAYCWPTLMGDVVLKRAKDLTDNCAVNAWILTGKGFWDAVRHTGHRYSAASAWDDWDGSDPNFDDVDDHVLGSSASVPLIWPCIRRALSWLDGFGWGLMEEKIMQTSAEAPLAGYDHSEPSRPMLAPLRDVPLPTERYDLDLMLKELDAAAAMLEQVAENEQQQSSLLAFWADNLALGPFVNETAGTLPKVKQIDVVHWEERGILGGRKYPALAHKWFKSLTQYRRLALVVTESHEDHEQAAAIAGMRQVTDEAHAAVLGILELVHSRRAEVITKLDNLNRVATALAKVEDLPASESRDEVAHSPDFRSVIWFGTKYQFSPTQAASVRCLWQAWEDGFPM